MEQTSRLSIVIDTGNAERDLQNLRRALTDLERSSSGTEQSLGDVGNSANNASRSLANSADNGTKLTRSLGMIKAAALGLAGIGLAGLGSQIVATQREFDVLNAQLITATGSIENASVAFSQLQEFAKTTPYGLAQSVEGFAKLKNLGLEPSIESLTSFGNTASAMGKDLMQMIEAVADATTGEFERLKEFGIKSSKQGDQITFTFQGVKTTVKNNAKDIQQYLLDIGNVNFAGAMDARAKTLDGAIASLGDSWSALLLTMSQGGIGDALAEVVRGLDDILGGITSKLKDPAVIEGFKITFGTISEMFNTIKTIIGEVITAIQNGTQFILDNAEAFTALASGISASATAFLAIKAGMAIFALFASGTATVTLLSTAISVLTGVAGAFGAVMAVITSPITLAVVAIGALVAAGVYLYRNWDEVKAKTEEVWFAIGEIMANMVDNIKGKWDEFYTAVGGTTAMIVENAVGKFNELKAKAKSIFDSLPAPVKTALTVIGTVVSTQFALIKNIFTTTFAVIKALVRGDMQGVANAIRTGLSNAVSIVRTMIGNIVGAFKNLGSQLLQAGRDAIQGFINGVKGKMSEALATARQMASQVASAVKSALDIHSPSRVMKKLGGHTAEGLAVGIKKDTPKAVKAAKKMAEDVKKAVADGVANLKREIALFNDNSPIAALKYDIGIGKYKGANTAELEALTAQKYALERNKVAYDEIDNIKRELATTGMNALQVLDWEIKNTHKYKDISADVLDKLKEQTAQKLTQLELQDKLNKSMQANERVTNNIAAAQKRLALRGNASKVAEFDYDWQHGAFAGADNMQLLRERDLLQQEERLDTADKAKTAFNDLSAKLNPLNPIANLEKEHGDKLTVIQNHLKAQKTLYADNAEQIKQVELDAQNATMQALSQFQTAKNDLILSQSEQVFGSMTSIAKSAFGEQSKAYRVMFAMEKGMAIARSVMAIQTAMAQAAANPFPYNLGAMATVASQVANIVSTIKSIAMPVGQAHDGIMSVPKSGTWNLEKGERVLPKHTAKALDDRLDNMGGSQVINVHVTVNSDGSNVQADTQMGKSMGEAMAKIARQIVIQETKQNGHLDRLYRR